MNWKTTSIGQYQMICDIGESLDRVDREIWVLSILTGKPYSYYEAMPMGKLEKLFDTTTFISKPIDKAINKRVRIGCYWYKFTANKNELLAHQFTAVQKMWQEDKVKNMHMILAYLSVKCNILGRPVKVKNAAHEFEKRSRLFARKLNFYDATVNLNFFSAFFTESLPIILPYLAKEVREALTIGGNG